MQFDWRTEEDDPLTPEPPPPDLTAASNRRWLIWLAVPAVIILAGLLVYAQLNRRVDEAHLQVEADVLAAFNLAQQALTQGDAELLTAVLDRGDVQWSREWGELAENGRYPLPIPPLLTPHDELDITAVNLSSELDKAEIVWRRPYTLHTGDAPEQIVYLQHIHFYEKKPTGWVWRPPDDESWGEWHTEMGQYLNLTYSELDEAFALPLAQELDALLTGWCEGELPANMQCPTRPSWTLRLNRNPASLSQTNNRPPMGGTNNLPLTPLPTVSLLGEPVDAAGLDALRRYYALQVGVALGQFNLNRSPQLSRSELINWFIKTELVIWSPADLSPTPPELNVNLAVHCRDNGSGSLWQYETAAGWRPLLPDQLFYEFLPWPGGGLFLGSRQELEDGLQVTFSRFTNGRLLPIYQFQPANPTPTQHPFQYGGMYPSLFFSMPTPVLFIVDQNDWLSYTADCDDNGCVLTPLGGNNTWEFTIWSPDGRYGLVYQNDGHGRLVNQAGNTLRELPQVSFGSAQWLDSERFIFAASQPAMRGPNITASLIIAHAGGERPDQIIPTADLLNDQDENLYLQLLPVGASGLNDRVILLGERAGPPVSGRPRLLLFSFELSGAEPTLTLRPLPTTKATYLGAFPLLSPDGRWLTLFSMDNAQTFVEIIDLDHETNWQVDLAEPWIMPDGFWAAPDFNNLPSWSPDGRWLSISHAGIIHLLDPERGEQTALTPPQPGCQSSAWLTR